MKFCIPLLGTQLVLTEDWVFSLHFESRNKALFSLVGWEVAARYKSGAKEPALVTIPKGSILRVERYYMRAGAPDFDSVTFTWVGKKARRFWAKLLDVQCLEFEPAAPESQPWWYGVQEKLLSGQEVDVEGEPLFGVDQVVLFHVRVLPLPPEGLTPEVLGPGGHAFLAFKHGSQVRFYRGLEPSWGTSPRLMSCHVRGSRTKAPLMSDLVGWVPRENHGL